MAIERPTPQQTILARVQEFTTSINLLLEVGHTLSALIILYTVIDILGSLLRPESDPDTKGDYFKKWVEDYMIPHSKAAFTPEELWGARCGLLHTHTAESRLSRQGKIRQIHYYRTHGSPVSPELQRIMTEVETQGDKSFLDIDALCGAFEAGNNQFCAAVQQDAVLQKRVMHHAQSLFGAWRKE